jgi:CRISPR-associated protein Csd2
MAQENIITKRYDFVLLFDVKDGNPNGDPDAGNLPRLDAETGNGLVTDVCLKRKVRNFVQLEKQGKERYDIFVKEKAILNNAIDEAYKDLGIDANAKKPAKGENIEKGRGKMCEKYFDIRTFGAVLSVGANDGQVRGPVQMTFARSVDPIVSLEHSITRMAVTKAEDVDKERTMGRKFTVPYGLYVSHGFISAHLAAQTGFNENDLNVFWEALEKMFWEDHSAARGEMNVRGLYVFEHDSALGRASAHELFEKIKIERKDSSIPARSFDDYKVAIDETMPEGVTLIRKVG